MLPDVVVPMHVVAQADLRLPEGAEPVPVHEFRLRYAVCGLHDGVVVRAALAGKRLDEPAILELPAKPSRGALAAPIRVRHESFFRIFPVHSVVKGVDYQILVDAGGTCHPTILRGNGSR